MKRSIACTITKAFYLSETEVTQESWQKVMGANPSNFKGASNPVEQVSWNDCQKFLPVVWPAPCERVGVGVRVPSGDDDGVLVWCEHHAAAGELRTHRGTVACGSLPANQWGFREMHGNVWEWCEDGYQATASSTQDAVNGNSPTFRVLRGGAWNISSDDVRSSNRDFFTPGNSHVRHRVPCREGPLLISFTLFPLSFSFSFSGHPDPLA